MSERLKEGLIFTLGLNSLSKIRPLTPWPWGAIYKALGCFRRKGHWFGREGHELLGLDARLMLLEQLTRQW